MESVEKLGKILKEVYGDRISISEKDDILTLNGELDNWNDIVRVGSMCADKKRRRYVVNNITLTGVELPKMRMPSIKDKELEGEEPDVLIIGAGVVGCAIARELARWDIKVLLLEKEHDVAMQASSRNDGMVHPGIDLKKRQLKQKYNAKGNAMYPDICRELGVHFQQTGQYLCFKEKWIKYALPVLMKNWKNMGVPVRLLKKKEILEKEPYLSKEIECALQFPTAGIVCPYELTIAYAENAVDNGVRLSLDTAVLDMLVEKGRILSVNTNRGIIYPKVVVNAAGVFCEDIAKMAKDHFYSIHPRKGTNLILDKKAAYQVATIASLLGTFSTKVHSKGGGIVSTVDGNLLVGPDAVETYKKEDYTTRASSISETIRKQRQVSEQLNQADAITYFSGIRAATYEEDFVIQRGRSTKNFIHAAGIQSPGLTAAPAIGVDVARMAINVLEEQEKVNKNLTFRPNRQPIIRMTSLPDSEREHYVKENGDYGVIICRCEEISKGEIIEVLSRSVPCDTLDGVKRRIRPGMGRCQGGFCGPLVAKLISETKGIDLAEVKKSNDKSNLFYGVTKGGDVNEN